MFYLTILLFVLLSGVTCDHVMHSMTHGEHCNVNATTEPGHDVKVVGRITSPPILISAKACTGLYMLFSSTPDVTDVIANVTISAVNPESWFSYLITPVSYVQVQGLHVDCHVYKDFWVNWGMNTISVGYGSKVGDDVFLEGTISEPINYLLLASQTSASWDIDVILEMKKMSS